MNWSEIKEKIMLLGKTLFSIEIRDMKIIKKEVKTKQTFQKWLISVKQYVEVHECLPLHNIL